MAKDTLVRGIVLLFFALQIVGIVHARFVPERFFCWAPYDQLSHYTISTWIKGTKLNKEAVIKRYQLRGYGRENRSIHNVFAIVSQYERTKGKEDSAKVIIQYQQNGKNKKTWYWPE